MAKARKEIDKESMYQKIMPSSIRATQSEDVPPPAPAAAPVPKRPPTPRAPKRVSAPGRPVPTFADEDDEDEEEAFTAHAAPAVAAAPMRPTAASARQPIPPPTQPTRWAQPAPSEKAAIVNIMERLIDEKIELAMEKFHCCNCAKCRQDITAFALNKLSPRYIVAEPELLADAMADKEANTQVTTALVQAILKVKANPNH